MGKLKKTKLGGYNKKKNVKGRGWSAVDDFSKWNKYKWWKNYSKDEDPGESDHVKITSIT